MKRYLVRSLLMSVMALALTLSMAAGVHATDLKEIFAKALTDHECNDTEWHFVITGIGGDVLPPASIHVVWANGAEADVLLDEVTGSVAHYTTTANLDWQVIEASTFIDEDWDGQFNLSHGPCDVIGPGKGVALGTLDAGTSGLSMTAGTPRTTRSAELPKTGDAEVQMAALLAALFGGALLLTGAAGRTNIRRA